MIRKEYSSPSRRILLIRPKCTYNITKCTYRYEIFSKMGCNRYLDKCIPQFVIYYRRITNPISSKENHFQLFRLHIIFYFTLTSILHHPAAMMHLSRHDIIHSFQVFLHTTKSKLNDEICRREIEI